MKNGVFEGKAIAVSLMKYRLRSEKYWLAPSKL